ncbi:hypothetical protein QBC44DRAFT_376248 [Cladorrhinum sp. PSN332]|nr:hypothetical protein QBC44DRAFT_376248 [Cladorrhinum sp. PSN332]
MSDSSDLSDNHSQSSDGEEHRSDFESHSADRAPIQGYLDDMAEEESGEEGSSHSSDYEVQGADIHFNRLSDSSSDGGDDDDQDIRNTNRPDRSSSFQVGGAPRGQNRMFGRPPIIDDMAEEGIEEPESDDEDFDGLDKRRQRDKTQYSFTQFKRLPLELRQRIWELFCPDLITKARFYQFRLISSSRDYRYGPAAAPEVWEGPTLSQQTEPARKVLSVHRESRDFALRSFPDELSLRGGRGIIRYHSERDVIYIEKSTQFDYQNHMPMPVLPGFSEKIRHVGIDPDLWSIMNPSLDAFLTAFPNMRYAYFVTDYTWTRARDMLWASDENHVNHYHLETFQERFGVGEDATYRWIWPNLMTKAGNEFARHAIKPGNIGLDDYNGDYAERAWAADLEVWPVILFPMDHGERAFQTMVDCVRRGDTDHIRWPNLDDGYDEESSSEEIDDYESSGIDDDSIHQNSDEESEDDLAVVNGDDTDRGDDESDEQEEDDREDGHLPVGAMHDETFNGFSDLETHPAEEPSSSATVKEESSDGSDSERPSSPPPRSTLKRGRSRVLESDSDENGSGKEDGDDEDIPRKRARTENSQRKRPSSSDSEEDSDGSAPAPSKRRRQTGRKRLSISDSDDESGGSGSDATPKPSTSGNRKRPRTLIVQSDDDSTEEERKMRENVQLLHPEEVEDEDESNSHHSSSASEDGSEEDKDSEDGSEEDDKPSRPLTLAEKLDLGRKMYPIPSSSDNDDEGREDDGGADVDAEPMGGTDYDARDYADFQDDEEGYGHLEDEYKGEGEREGDEADGREQQYFDDGEDYGEGGEW